MKEYLMATTKKSTKKVEDIDIESTEQQEETKKEVKETKKVSDKKYVVLTVTSSPVAVTKEQYEEIKKSASNVVESETDDTIYIRVIK
jgi:hypothetical protein